MKGNDSVLPQSYLLSVDNDLSNLSMCKMQGLCYLLWKGKLDGADKNGVMAFVRRQKPLGTIIASFRSVLGPHPHFAPAET